MVSNNTFIFTFTFKCQIRNTDLDDYENLEKYVYPSKILSIYLHLIVANLLDHFQSVRLNVF